MGSSLKQGMLWLWISHQCLKVMKLFLVICSYLCVNLNWQVRDDMMVYLLMNTSIFLTLSQKRHHQVAGLPVNNLCNKLSEYSTGSSNRRNLSGKHDEQDLY